MTLYVKFHPNYMVEIIAIMGRVKTKKIHLLINPERDLDKTPNNKYEIDLPKLTHLFFIRTTPDSGHQFEFMRDLSETLNIPIILEDSALHRATEHHINRRQIRTLTAFNEVYPKFKLGLIKYEPKIHNAESERIKFKNEKSEIQQTQDFIMKVINTTTIRPINSVFARIPQGFKNIFRPIKRIRPKLPLIVDEPESDLLSYYPMTLKIEFKTDVYFIPLTSHGNKHMLSSARHYLPKVVIKTQPSISDIQDFNGLVEKLVLIDNKVDKDQFEISEFFNPSIHTNMTIGALGQWIEISL